MRLELTGRHVVVSPAIHRIVERKLAHLERLLDHRVLSAQVILSKSRRLLRVDVTLHARGDRFFHSAGQASGWSTAVTAAAGKIVQQAQKIKRRPSEGGSVRTRRT